MRCDHCGDGSPPTPTRTFDVPGSTLLRLCDVHAESWIVDDVPDGTVEVVEVELLPSDIGVVADLAGHGASDETAMLVPRSTYVRWSAARAAWEDAQDEMTTELTKSSVGAMQLTSDLTKDGRAGA